MDLKAKLKLSRQLNGLLKELSDKSLPIFDRIKKGKERISILRELKASVKDGAARPKIGDDIPNAEIIRHSATDIEIKRQVDNGEVVMYVKVNRERGEISVINGTYKFLNTKPDVFDYSNRYSSFSDTVMDVNRHIIKNLDNLELAKNKINREREAEKSQIASNVKGNLLAAYEAQADTLKKAIDAYNGMVKRDKEGKLPTKAQEFEMREAILDFGPTAAAYDGLGGLWRAGEIFPKRLANIQSEIVDLKGQLESSMADKFIAGEYISSEKSAFRRVLELLKDKLSLEELKEGTFKWFEYHQSELSDSNEVAA